MTITRHVGNYLRLYTNHEGVTLGVTSSRKCTVANRLMPSRVPISRRAVAETLRAWRKAEGR